MTSAFQEIVEEFYEKKNSELEVRFVRFTPHIFKNDVGKPTFDTILKILDDMSRSDLCKKVTTTYNVSMYKNGLRKLITNNQVKYEVKRVIKKIDLVDDGLRLVLSSETPSVAGNANKKDFTYSFTRTRSSFIFPSGGETPLYRLDLSHDYKFIGNSQFHPQHQIEMEFIRNESFEVNYLSIKSAIQLAYNIEVLLKDQWNAISEFNGFFQPNKSIFKVYKPEKMPKALSINDVLYLQHHYIFPKLDGVMHYLVVLTDIIYIINSTDVKIFYKGSDIPKSIRGSVLFGEWMTQTSVFYVFDCLFHQNIDLREHTLTDRLKSLDNIVHFMKLPYVQVLERFYDENLHDRINNAWSFTDQKYKDLNDGLIFRDANLPFQNDFLYKWKPRSHMTIDLLMKTCEQRQEVRAYHLYTKQGNKIIPFVNPAYRSTVGVGDLRYGQHMKLSLEDAINLDGHIIELAIPKFNPNVQQGLRVIRLRNDKTTPNSLQTVNHTLEISKNYINIKKLLTLSTYAINLDNIDDPDGVKRMCDYQSNFSDIDTTIFLNNLKHYVPLYYNLLRKKLFRSPINKKVEQMWAYFNKNTKIPRLKTIVNKLIKQARQSRM
jgi:hypothetical protein